MAKSNVPAWDTTAANNTDVGGVTIDQAVSTADSLDDIFQAIMAQIASFTRRGADTATASTLNLDGTPNMFLDLSGTTTVTAVTLTAGHSRRARAQGVFILTASSSLIVNGSTSTNYTTAAGDLLFFEGYGSSVVRVWAMAYGTVPTAAAASDVWAGTSSTKYVTPSIMQAALVEQSLTDGATITIDFSLGINFKVTLGGNRTLAASNISGLKGRTGHIKVTQDGTGSRTLDTSGSTWKNVNGQDVVLSTTAAAVDKLYYEIQDDGTTVLLSLARAIA